MLTKLFSDSDLLEKFKEHQDVYLGPAPTQIKKQTLKFLNFK